MPALKTRPQRSTASSAVEQRGIEEILTLLNNLPMKKAVRMAVGKPLQMAPLFEKFVRAVIESRQSGNQTRFSVAIDRIGNYRIGDLEKGGRTVKASMPVQTVTPRERSLDDALASARARGQRQVAEILAGDEMLNAEAFANRIGTTRATINTWRKSNRVLGLEGATRGVLYPDWQIDSEGRPFKALQKLFDLLGGRPWTVYRFLVQPHAELDGLSGREALRRDGDDVVLQVAESVARGDI